MCSLFYCPSFIFQIPCLVYQADDQSIFSFGYRIVCLNDIKVQWRVVLIHKYFWKTSRRRDWGWDIGSRTVEWEDISNSLFKSISIAIFMAIGQNLEWIVNWLLSDESGEKLYNGIWNYLVIKYLVIKNTNVTISFLYFINVILVYEKESNFYHYANSTW